VKVTWIWRKQLWEKRENEDLKDSGKYELWKVVYIYTHTHTHTHTHKGVPLTLAQQVTNASVTN